MAYLPGTATVSGIQFTINDNRPADTGTNCQVDEIIYSPANTELVGIRVIDASDLTIPPYLPGLAPDDCGGGCNGYDAIPCSAGTCDYDDGSQAQLYGDTGIFYTTDARMLREPITTFLGYDNGYVITPEPRDIARPAGLLGVSSPYYAHNLWDYIQVRAFGNSNSASDLGANSGNTQKSQSL